MFLAPGTTTPPRRAGRSGNRRRAPRALAVPAALLAVAASAPAATGPGAAATPQDPPPALTAGAYILIDAATGEVLAARRPDRALPMASTTKIMTALLTVERAGLDDVAVVPREALVGGSTAELVAGERVTVRDLLTGLMVPSGNDAAITLAVHVAGSQARFVRLMNARARELGLTRTTFRTPHGLDRPGHAASVRDLVALAREAMTHAEIRDVVARRTASIPAPGGGTRTYVNQNDLLFRDPDVDGVKTGHTDGAGYALVAHARRERLGVELYAAFIGAPTEEARVQDGARLLDWGFARFARPTLVLAGQIVGRAKVRDRPGVTVALRARAAVRGTVRLGEAITESVVALPEVVAPVRRGQVVGRVTVRAGTRVLGASDLVAATDVAAPGVADRLRSALDQVTP